MMFLCKKIPNITRVIDPMLMLLMCMEILFISSCEPMETTSTFKTVAEQHSFSFRCIGQNNETTMRYYVTNAGVKTLVGECTHDYVSLQTQCNLTQSNYSSDYAIANDSDKSSPFATFLEVFSMPRELTQILCERIGDNSSFSACEITVVVSPNAANCNSSVINSGEIFQVVCRFLVYPQGACSISRKFIPPNGHSLQIQETNNYMLTDIGALYETTCTLTVNVKDVWNRPFAVEMFPGVQNRNSFTLTSYLFSLEYFNKSLVFDYNTSITYINVIKQLAVDFRCHVHSIHTVPNLTISLYKGDLHRLVYKSPVVNDLQYTTLMSPCGSEVYICRTDIDIIAEKRITVHEKSCGHEDSVIITVSVTLPCTFIFLVLIIGRLVTSARRRLKLRIANKKAEDRLAGDIHLTRVETQCNQDNKQDDSINDLPASYTGS